MKPHSYRSEAMALLLVGGAGQFAWHHVPASAAADVWNASQAMLLLLLLAMVAVAYRGYVAVACAMLGVWKALTAACSLAWLYKPWPITPGDGQCSAALDMPIGAMQAWLLVALVVGIAGHRARGGPNSGNQGER